ncbi:MAG: hypothetical protein NT155_00060 [Candidatus Staskawiczbacteria bacterium]|nr:hypothetical protein [Candidatus Staskawiczbacteria bacterium]
MFKIKNVAGPKKTTSKPKAPKTDKDSEEGGKAGAGGSGAGNLISPEGVLMFSVAALFDTIGLIPVVGDFSDIVAGIVFGFWTLTKEGGGKKLIKFVIALILEAIPIVSDITPFVSLIGMLFGVKIPASWVGYVYSVL